MCQQESAVPRRKNGMGGLVLVIIGVLALGFAVFEYSVYSQNKDTLEWNQTFGTDTPEQHDLVESQLTATIGAFSVGSILVVIGIIIMLSAYFHNREIDRAELLLAVRGQGRPNRPSSEKRAFCENCGSPLNPDQKFCHSCGRNLQY